MSMEIGSIFELAPEQLFEQPAVTEAREEKIPFCRAQLHRAFFESGRSAISALLSRLRPAAVWMPSFVCSSVVDAVRASEAHLVYYPIGRELCLTAEDLISMEPGKGDCLYLIRYFSVSYSEEFWQELARLKQEKGLTVIEDLSLEMFSEIRSEVVDYAVCSLRKWMPIPDGGVIASPHPLSELTPTAGPGEYTLYYLTAQLMKHAYLKDKTLDKQRFLHYANRGIARLFEDDAVRGMSELSQQLLRQTDFETIQQRRIENYDCLHALLSEIPELQIPGSREGDSVPLGMFMLTEERDALLAYLIQHGIYCNVHWRTSEITAQHESSRFLSAHCLTIPCDQRYGREEMQYIHQVIREFFHRASG